MSLETGFELSSPRVTKVPITDIVIQTVEDMAKRQGFKTLKFQNRKGEVYHDESLIAGVERAASAAENNNYEENDPDTTDSDESSTMSDNASEAEDDHGNDSVRDDDSSDSTVEEKDEEEYDILNRSNQKTRNNTKNDFGEFVEDLQNINELPILVEEQYATKREIRRR